MFIKKTKFKDLCIITQKPYYDNRGFFVELFNKQNLKHINFVIKQVNFSFSKKNVFRGMHFQIAKPQSKIIGVIEGEIEDLEVAQILEETEIEEGVFLYPCSLKNRRVSEDPTKWIPNRDNPNIIRIGLAHGTTRNFS